MLSQSVASIEVLLIGHDDVQQLLDRLPADPRLRPVARQSPGISGALNTGLKLARGTFMARMDDDDVCYPQRLATQLDYLEQNPRIDLCATRVRFVDSRGATQGVGAGNRRYEQWLNSLIDADEISHSCYIESPMPHPTLMAHRDVWQQLQGYRDFDGPEDYDLVLRAKLKGMRMGKPDEVLLDWREHEQRLTHTDCRYRREAFTRCRAWAAWQSESGLSLHKGRGVWLCGTGRNARQWHDELIALGGTVHGFVDVDSTSEQRGQSPVQRSKRGKPVISYAQLPVLREDSLIIGALSAPAARRNLEHYFAQQRWVADLDYVLGA